MTVPSASPPTVLEVQDIKIRFHTQDGIVHAVNGVSFNLRSGELLGVVGESSSGKSVTMMSLLKLLPTPPAEISSGSAYFDGMDLIGLGPDQIRDIRGKRIGFIFQDPMTSLNPVLSVGFQLTEHLRKHMGMNRRESRARAAELLTLVGIPEAGARLNDYPHQFSGGMRQRVMIAIALACDPEVLIADEPTTALDVTIQAQILELVKRLRRELGMSIIWITHDLGVVAGMADRVMVMYGGYIVERADVKKVYGSPRHPYTEGLLNSLPRVDVEGDERLVNIEGQPPMLMGEPSSCPFAPRCPHAFERCLEENPPLTQIADGHEVACWYDLERGAPRDDV